MTGQHEPLWKPEHTYTYKMRTPRKHENLQNT